jgi:tight adherence protein C
VVPVSSTIAWGVACGLALGLGLWSIASLVPRLSRPTLTSRVAPYVLDVSAEARRIVGRTPSDPLPVLGAVLSPPITAVARLVEGVVGGAESTAHRLRQAGLAMSVTDFRSRQLVWAVLGGGLGVAIAIAANRFQSVPVVAQAGIVILFAVGGFVGRDYLLQREARARLARMQAELPTVLEFLTLSLSAGEGILDAVRRVSRISRGELARELALVVAETNTGVPFADAVTRTADALQLAPFSRFTEQLTGALERGTPLAEVLRAQAQDARDQAKRELLESAGRKEVAMLVPLVFLILPTTIAFAIFPGILVLQVGF